MMSLFYLMSWVLTPSLVSKFLISVSILLGTCIVIAIFLECFTSFTFKNAASILISLLFLIQILGKCYHICICKKYVPEGTYSLALHSNSVNQIRFEIKMFNIIKNCNFECS